MKYIWFIVFFAAYVLYLRYLMHMFQLNSYKAAEQNNWMKKNRGVIVLHAAFSVVSFIVLAAAGSTKKEHMRDCTACGVFGRVF